MGQFRDTFFRQNVYHLVWDPFWSPMQMIGVVSFVSNMFLKVPVKNQLIRISVKA